jgi:hypothetical protein
MKLKYFQSHGWKQDWIDTVREIVMEEFAKYNKVVPTQDAPASSAVDDLMDFGDIPMDNVAEVSELDTYLSQPVEKVRDAIAWWWDHRAVFPRLSSMALDYLSGPGMCRTFSHSCIWLTMISNLDSSRESFFTGPAAATLHPQSAVTSIYSRLTVSRGLESKRPSVYIRHRRGDTDQARQAKEGG